MSLEALTRVWKHSKAEHGDLLVVLAIADYMNENGAAWPSIDTIARKSRLNRRTVFDRITALVAMGELTVERGQSTSNVYRLGSVYQGWSEMDTGRDGGAESARAENAPVQKPVGDLHPIRKEPDTSDKSLRGEVLEGSGAETARHSAPLSLVPVEDVDKFREALVVQGRVPKSVRDSYLGAGLTMVRVGGGVDILYPNEYAPRVAEKWRTEIDAVIGALGWGALNEIRAG